LNINLRRFENNSFLARTIAHPIYLLEKRKKNETNNRKGNILIPFIILNAKPTFTPGPKRDQLVTLHINYDLLKRHEKVVGLLSDYTHTMHTYIYFFSFLFFFVVVSFFFYGAKISTICNKIYGFPSWCI
jgi:hypothetical protein